MEYSKESEFQLVKEILNGDRQQYRLLVDRYAPVVFHVVRRYTNDESVVEELAQQVFVKCYERLDSFRMDARFSSWLYVIANNHCKDFINNVRRTNIRFSEIGESEEALSLVSEKSADHEIELRELQRLLQKALKHVNPDYAEAFLFKYRDGMTYQAMSKRLDVSIPALKVRVHRARKELKVFIENRKNK